MGTRVASKDDELQVLLHERRYTPSSISIPFWSERRLTMPIHWNIVPNRQMSDSLKVGLQSALPVKSSEVKLAAIRG
jgi:hypothetical protein